jgi:hypothetical protein
LKKDGRFFQIFEAFFFQFSSFFMFSFNVEFTYEKIQNSQNLSKPGSILNEFHL